MTARLKRSEPLFFFQQADLAGSGKLKKGDKCGEMLVKYAYFG